MKYYSYYDSNGKIVTVSEDEIIDIYYKPYCQQMIEKHGVDTYWKSDCIDAFCTINAAWESD